MRKLKENNESNKTPQSQETHLQTHTEDNFITRFKILTKSLHFLPKLLQLYLIEIIQLILKFTNVNTAS